MLGNLKQIAERCLQDIRPTLDTKGHPVTVEDQDGNACFAFTFNAAGATRATELLGKALGMFKETVVHDATDGLADVLAQIRQSNVESSPLPSGE